MKTTQKGLLRPLRAALRSAEQKFNTRFGWFFTNGRKSGSVQTNDEDECARILLTLADDGLLVYEVYGSREEMRKMVRTLLIQEPGFIGAFRDGCVDAQRRRDMDQEADEFVTQMKEALR